MSLASYPDEVATRIHLILDVKLPTLLPAGASLFYGDQDKIPTTPTVCVEAGTTARDLAGAPMMVLNRHDCFVLLYHSKVQSVETNKLESEQFAKAIAKELDGNPQLVGPNGEEGIVTNGFCVSIDPGYAVKEGTLYRAVRIQWSGTAKTRLGA